MWQLRRIGVKLQMQIIADKSGSMVSALNDACRPISSLESVINYFVFLGSNPHAHQLRSSALSIIQHDSA